MISINYTGLEHVIEVMICTMRNAIPGWLGIRWQNQMIKRFLIVYRSLIRITILFALFFTSFPAFTKAEIVDYNIVTDEFYGLNAERILLVSDPIDADRRVRVVGKCKGRGATDLYLEDDPTNARETWFVVSRDSDLEPDLSICLSGNAPSWFEKAAHPYG